jgi:hypothetical protein
MIGFKHIASKLLGRVEGYLTGLEGSERFQEPVELTEITLP